MSKRYQLWNGSSSIVTPSNEVFTPQEWLVKYPWFINAEETPMVISSGFYSGGFCMPLMALIHVLESAGAEFSNELDTQEILDEIEAWEDAKNAEAANAISPEERMAAALEYQNLLAM